MAAAVLLSRGTFRNRSISFKRVDSGNIPIRVLPDNKEWLAEHELEIHMLDG